MIRVIIEAEVGVPVWLLNILVQLVWHMNTKELEVAASQKQNVQNHTS